MAEIKRLHARVAALGIILSNVQAEATRVLDMEPQIAELERLHTEQQKSYDLVVAGLEQSKKSESMGRGTSLI